MNEYRLTLSKPTNAKYPWSAEKIVSADGYWSSAEDGIITFFFYDPDGAARRLVSFPLVNVLIIEHPGGAKSLVPREGMTKNHGD